MAAALALEAHGRLIRLAAQAGGLHCQGLGALAASLRRSGSTSSRLLRRLFQLDAAAGVLRHITVISVAELEADLKLELVKLGAANGVPEIQYIDKVPQQDRQKEFDNRIVQLPRPEVSPQIQVEQ